jgi:SAM-dependent methyltransferase
MKTTENLDWQHWVDRLDRMQERYLVGRQERFGIIVQAIRAVCPQPHRILDLGCGTGSLTAAVLAAFPGCQAVGVDLDASLLLLAKHRLAQFGSRVKLLNEDLRDTGWIDKAGGGLDAAVSATALHWLSAAHLAELYRRVGAVLKPGGIFLNADHAGSERPAIQTAWQEQKRAALVPMSDREVWSDFWRAYAAALGWDPGMMGSNVVGAWEGVEDGMPMAWHFARLRESGFAAPECFWRFAGDAVYGALRGSPRVEIAL